MYNCLPLHYKFVHFLTLNVYYRAISVLLGDDWQKMAIGSRHVYAEKAKQMADQQKKMHPDCWKRKK